MRAETATGKRREGGVDVGVVCSEREEAGLAAAAVALRRLSGLVALRRDLAALVAAARWLLRGGGAVAPVRRAPAATVGHCPAPALAASVEPVAPRGARRRGRSEHRAVRAAPRRRLLRRRCSSRLRNNFIWPNSRAARYVMLSPRQATRSAAAGSADRARASGVDVASTLRHPAATARRRARTPRPCRADGRYMRRIAGGVGRGSKLLAAAHRPIVVVCRNYNFLQLCTPSRLPKRGVRGVLDRENATVTIFYRPTRPKYPQHRLTWRAQLRASSPPWARARLTRRRRILNTAQGRLRGAVAARTQAKKAPRGKRPAPAAKGRYPGRIREGQRRRGRREYTMYS